MGTTCALAEDAGVAQRPPGPAPSNALGSNGPAGPACKAEVPSETRISESLCRALLNSGQLALLAVDNDRILYGSLGFWAMATPHCPTLACGQPFTAMLAREDRERVLQALAATQQSGAELRLECSMVGCPADQGRILVQGVRVNPVAGSALALILTLANASTINFLESHDSLTGLLNRNALLREATAALYRAQAQQTPLALLLIDLDNFSRFNDEQGPDAGDTALIWVEEMTVKLVALVAPNFTAVVPVKPVPVMTTVVPPAPEPNGG